MTAAALSPTAKTDRAYVRLRREIEAVLIRKDRDDCRRRDFFRWTAGFSGTARLPKDKAFTPGRERRPGSIVRGGGFFRGAALWLVGALGWGLPAAAAEAEPERVDLAPFEVTALKEGLPWEYGSVMGTEVLTLSSRRYSRAFVEALLRARQLVPREFLAEWTTPPALLLINQDVAKLKAAPETMKVRPGLRRLGHGWRGARGLVTSEDGDSLVVAAALRGEPDIGRVVYPWMWKSFEAAAPRHAPWLREGLFGEFGLFAELGRHPGEDRLRVASLHWIDDEQTEALKRAETPDPALLPWDEFFNRPPPDRGQAPSEFARWQAQAGLFCRWVLLAEKDRSVDLNTFWRWAYAVGRRNVGEEGFRRVFNLDYAAASQAMLAYLRVSVRAPQDFGIPGLHARQLSLPLSFRPATEAEVARLKGNFERMEAARLRDSQPELAARYEAAARRTLRRGLRHSPDDPALHGLQGLIEASGGNAAEARTHLERAFAGGGAGSRALLALARLRLEEGLGGGAQLSGEAMASVLEVLFAARERSPAVVEVYELLAEVWGRSEVQPKAAHLAVLVEGVELFPENAALRQRVVTLHRRHGFEETAAQLESGGPVAAPAA